MSNIKMKSTCFVLSVIAFLFGALLSADGPKFYSDDPIWNVPDSQNVTDVIPSDIDLIYDLAENMFSRPGDKATNVRAQNVNTVDEVPDSSWFTNRIGMKQLTPEEVAKGPDTTDGPADGDWTVIAAKNDGVSPGFTVKDTTGKVWFIKFDPPGYPAMATGTEVVVTKLFWALGYNVPENHIAKLHPKNLVIGEEAKVKTPSGKKRPMRQSDIKAILRQVEISSDGTYRVHASLALPGKVLGGIRFYGTRPDDPNDVVPHEHRRELRGYRVFAAWFNHVDSKAINAMDTLVTENGKSFVRHHLIDFSSTLGSGSIYPHAYWEGYEYLFEGGGPVGKDIISLGFRVEPWRTLKFYESPSIGRMQMDNTKWDPESWVPRVPNAAFLRARDDDKFWAACKAMAITDDMIRAVVKTGQFNDPKSEEYLANALIQRRNAIGGRYLTAINPVVEPIMDSSGMLTFKNAAVDAGAAKEPQSYQVVWYRFDNISKQSTKIGGKVGSAGRFEAPPGLPTESGSFLKVEIGANEGEHPSWQNPVTAYFRLDDRGWTLVGFERMS